MLKRIAIGLPMIATLCFSSWCTETRAQQLTAAEVRRSIDRGVEFLKNEFRRQGNWRDVGSFKGGGVALCTLSLLNTGLTEDDPVVSDALKILNRVDYEQGGTYSTSLIVMVYAMANPKKYKDRIIEGVEVLEGWQVQQGQNAGGWSYGRRGRFPDGRADASNSQFALLALHEAALVGVQIDAELWKRARIYWMGCRNRSGGFCYTIGINSRNRPATGSMTCAGISSLIIIEENLAAQDLARERRIVCCGNDEEDDAIGDAVRWMSKRFSTRINPHELFRGSGGHYHYYMYGMERAGRLLGRRFFGDHDWYREGAERLVRVQGNDGSWRPSGGDIGIQSEISTAFALLFLAKGRRPVVVGKFEHGAGRDWNRHPKGVHFLTRALEKVWQTKLNWQTIDGNTATTDDLLEAPVLFISGRDSLDFSPQQVERLREFVDYGGFIFAEACQGDGCGEDKEFDRKFKLLMAEMFPNSELLLLPDSHQIFQAQFPLTAKPSRPLFGIQSSCRTSVVYCPRNLSCLWQMNRPAIRSQLNDAALQEVEYTTRLGINVLAYATGRELKDKMDRQKVVDAENINLGERVMVIPKLTHAGGADDAPNAWLNLLRRAQYDLQLRIKLERKIVPADVEVLGDYPMMFMHGRTEFEFSDAQRKVLRQYFMERDGFLFVDCVCGSKSFANAFRAEMQRILPETPLERIPPDHPMWSESTAQGYDLSSVTLRRPGRAANEAVQETKTAPIMEGIRIDGRLAVVFSPYDLSCALENSAKSQCVGYSREDASRIGVNVLLFALRQD